MIEKVKSAAEDSLDRLFRNFETPMITAGTVSLTARRTRTAMPSKRWTIKDNPDKHPVSAAVLSAIGSGKKERKSGSNLKTHPMAGRVTPLMPYSSPLHTSGHLRAVNKGTVLSTGQTRPS